MALLFFIEDILISLALPLELALIRGILAEKLSESLTIAFFIGSSLLTAFLFPGRQPYFLLLPIIIGSLLDRVALVELVTD
jgi:hypothetical protein